MGQDLRTPYRQKSWPAKELEGGARRCPETRQGDEGWDNAEGMGERNQTSESSVRSPLRARSVTKSFPSRTRSRRS